MKCHICGKDFISKRSDAKTCSGACRTKLSRLPDNIEDIRRRVLQDIQALSRYSHIPDVSELACRTLTGIRTDAYSYELHDDESLWQCQNCGVLQRGMFPNNDKCACSSPVWLLQKKMI